MEPPRSHNWSHHGATMVLGITGISGSGKHTAARFLEKKGWVILDADKVAHDLYRPYTGVWKRIVKEFGEEILTKQDVIDRVKLGKIVFNAAQPKESALALHKLNQIVHPFIQSHIQNVIHRHFRRGSDIAIVVALWQESGLEELCEKLILIKTDPELRQKRIQGRDGISSETYQMRIKNQTEPPNPDFVIENNGTSQEFNEKLEELIKSLNL